MKQRPIIGFLLPIIVIALLLLSACEDSEPDNRVTPRHIQYATEVCKATGNSSISYIISADYSNESYKDCDSGPRCVTKYTRWVIYEMAFKCSNGTQINSKFTEHE